MADEPIEEQVDEGFGDGADSGQDKLRKTIAARVQKMLSTDEGVRTLVGAVVPKELIANTLESVDGARNEAVAMVGRELRNFLEHLDVGEELAKILTSVSFEIRMEVRFIPNEDGTLRANVRGGARPKVADEPKKRRWRRKGDDDAVEDEADEPAPEAAPADLRSSSPARSEAKAPEAEDEAGAEPRKRRLGRRSLATMVQGVADVAASTARVAAEVAADAAAEVVNEARRSRDDDDDDLDTY